MDDAHLEIAIQAARVGAAELMRFRERFSVQEKAPKDLVTDADLASQRAIFEVLREAYPDHAMVGEEEGFGSPTDAIAAGRSEQPCWIVDPLDGTLNYVHRLHSFCVSIGMILGDSLQVGVVLDPLYDELFVAVRGGGATVSRVDGSERHAIRPSGCQKIGEAMLVCSLRPNVKRDDPDVQQFCELVEAARSLRRLGSCALNLCYLASGRLDGYWAQSVKPWDVAAGALIVEEAGGTIGPIDEKAGEASSRASRLNVWDPRFCAAATPLLRQQMLERLHAAGAVPRFRVGLRFGAN